MEYLQEMCQWPLREWECLGMLLGFLLEAMECSGMRPLVTVAQVSDGQSHEMDAMV